MPSRLTYFPRLVRRARYTSQSKYNRYRNEIREDSKFRCVYCDVHELELGCDPETRDQRMTLDHLRPQSLYNHLKNDPCNLVLSCGTCNQKKADDWPAYGTSSTVNRNAGYLDPFEVDRTNFFRVEDDGSLTPLQPPATYMIRSLALNRPAARRIRRRRKLLHDNLVSVEKYLDRKARKIEYLLQDETLSEVVVVQYKKRLYELRFIQASLESVEHLIKLY